MRWLTLPRRRVLLCLSVIWIIVVVVYTATAQNAATLLTAGTPISGAIDTATVARVYSFTASAGDTVSLTAAGELPLALLLTDTGGAVFGQAADASASGSVTISGIVLAQAGTYFVTVFPAPGTSADASGTFQITLNLPAETATPETTAEPEVTLNPEATAEPTSVTPVTTTFQASQDIRVDSGMEVRLEWSSQVDLNLEVRDPLGNPLFWDSRNSPIGGRFAFDANGLCEIIAETPLETASWIPGFLPSGSYEILVFYRQSCVTPAQPVTFTVTTTVNGTRLEPLQATLTPPIQGQNSVYVANFVLNTDGTALINTGGIYPDTSLNILPAPAPDIQAAAQPITRDTPVTGAIFGQQPYLAYAFDAEANEVVSISLTRTSGSLDTLLQLVDASGALVDVNDDSADSTNSVLGNIVLARGGRYTIVATRYGKEIGGTEGEFELVLTGSSDALPPEVASLNLPQGAVEISLTWATSADIQLLVRDPVGDSVFDDEPTVNSGGLLAVNGNVNCVLAAGTPVSYIYWPFLRPGTYEIEVWYQNDCGDPTPVEVNLTALVNGQVVVAERQRPQLDQRFVISFTVNADGTAVPGEGGFASDEVTSFDYLSEQSSSLTPNQPVIGQIASDNFFDVYAFQGVAGQTVTISMNTSSGTLDPKLFLVSPTGLQVAHNDDAVPGDVINALISEFTLEEDGIYVVVATRYGIQFGGTAGSYTLNVQQN
jgi:hypothetical protein